MNSRRPNKALSRRPTKSLSRKPIKSQMGGTTSVITGNSTNSTIDLTSTTSVNQSLPCNELIDSSKFQASFVEPPPINQFDSNNYQYINKHLLVHTMN